jgi:hypothetical protein
LDPRAIRPFGSRSADFGNEGHTAVRGKNSSFLVVAAMSLPARLSAERLDRPRPSPNSRKKTGKPCGACHVNWGGGGQLKPAGEKYKTIE